jgi:hypothetical protein
MIKYRIKPKKIEIEYNTGLELKYIMNILSLLDIINEIKGAKK